MSFHFIPVNSTYRVQNNGKLYIDEIVRWHVIFLSIISDRGDHFTSHYWRYFQRSLGTQVKLNTSIQPHTDGQVVCTIQTLEEMVRACLIDFKGSWDDHFPLIEFS